MDRHENVTDTRWTHDRTDRLGQNEKKKDILKKRVKGAATEIEEDRRKVKDSLTRRKS